MKLTRIRFSEDVSAKLSQLKSTNRTGLTPNILCRIAFCMSVEQPSIPDPDEYPADANHEIERHVLLGPWDHLFVAMIKERCKRDGIGTDDEEVLGTYFRAHVHRGVYLLHKRVKNIGDLIHLMPRELRDDALASA